MQYFTRIDTINQVEATKLLSLQLLSLVISSNFVRDYSKKTVDCCNTEFGISQVLQPYDTWPHITPMKYA